MNDERTMNDDRRSYWGKGAPSLIFLTVMHALGSNLAVDLTAE